MFPRIWLIALASAALTYVSQPANAASPVASGSISCTGGNIVVQAQATDTDSDIVNLKAEVTRYGSESDCQADFNPEATTVTIDKSYVGPKASASESSSNPCVNGKWYKATITATDALNNTSSVTTVCCECSGSSVIPTLSEWGLLVLSIAVLLVGAVFLRRRGHRLQPV